MKRVLVTLRLPSPGIELLQERFEVQEVEAEGMPSAALQAYVSDSQGIVGMANVAFTKEVMSAAPGLRCIANYAVGYNNIDVPAATDLGIMVTNTPGVLTEATADLTMALLLALARRVVEGDRFLRDGLFHGWKPDLFLGSDVHGRVLGVIGLGRIGQAVARRARGFYMSVLYTQRHKAQPHVESDLRAVHVSLDELLRRADFVSIHCPLTDETHHLIGDRELQLMGPDHYLINASRGPIVDEAALVRALKQGWIKGAALDVYEREPTVEPGLVGCPNAVLVPHIGSATVAARAAMAETAARNLIAALNGERPPNLVNPEVLARA